MLESAGMRAVCRALRRSRAPLQHVDLSMNDAASFAAPAIARLLVAKRRTLVTGACASHVRVVRVMCEAKLTSRRSTK